MAQIRGTSGYNLGGPQQHSFGGGGGGMGGAGGSRSADGTGAGSDRSPLEMVREQTSKIEDWLDTLSEPVKPYVPPFPPLSFSPSSNPPKPQN